MRRSRDRRPSDEDVLRNLLKKREFVERYGAAYGPAKLPLRLRLSYDTFAQRDFTASTSVELVFNLFGCAQELLDDYCIRLEPSSILLQVMRPDISMILRKPKATGRWIDFLDFRITEETPYFSFEELELAHLELWPCACDYARHSMNPCGEIPLIEQNCGRVFPKG